MIPRKEILSLREQGLSYGEISKITGTHKATVGWIINNPDSLPRAVLYDWKEVQKYYDNNHTVRETIKYFGMSSSTWNHAIKRGDAVSRKKNMPLNELLVEDRPQTNRGYLKNRLIKEKILIEVCERCGIGPEWNGEKLSLQLEHKNGKNKDNRLENLCLLCPNCHSQTETFAGKNCIKRREVKHCIDCDKDINYYSTRCVWCSARKNRNYKKEKFNKNILKTTKDKHVPRLSTRKIERPSSEELHKLLWEMPTTKIAELYGVSDVAVGKWAKSYGISKPSRGYWGFTNQPNPPLTQGKPTVIN